MIRFESDYTEGAHQNILDALVRTNLEQTIGYGVDPHCEHARELIKKACEREDANVHFLVGGTQANVTVIDAALKSYQAAVCVESGHINVHETGALEATGHKILTAPGMNGKITAKEVREICEEHFSDPSAEHTVQPGIVYISHPTEVGTLYSKKELEDLHTVCKEYDIPLFLDGARLGYGLMSTDTDVTLQDIARLCDVFYIGGTKVGALFGEAVVITDARLNKDFRYHIKQKGGMLAKGRLLGIQFEELFQNDLYFQLGEHADKLAMKIKKAFEDKNIPFAVESFTNQQFPILTYEQAMKLAKKYAFTMNEANLKKGPDQVRFCTSWATKEEDVDALVADIATL